MERLTRATATGFAIAWSKDNWTAWEKGLGHDVDDPESKVQGFHRTVGFLAKHFPGSVRTVKRDN
jgi:hypothetical protein